MCWQHSFRSSARVALSMERYSMVWSSHAGSSITSQRSSNPLQTPCGNSLSVLLCRLLLSIQHDIGILAGLWPLVLRYCSLPLGSWGGQRHDQCQCKLSTTATRTATGVLFSDI